MRGSPITYTAEELAWIEARAQEPRRETHAAFCARFGRRDVSLSNLNALCKRKGWLTGRTGRYEPGRTPENKGKKMPYNENSARTRFQAGHRPHNYRGPGHEFVDPKDGYVFMIVTDENARTRTKTSRVMKHKYLWEREHGPVPEGHRLKCLDGDKTNCNPANWEAVPLALAPRLNGRFGRGYDTAPAELKPAILAVAKLEHKVREAKKGKA